jgi:hypothetical protein
VNALLEKYTDEVKAILAKYPADKAGKRSAGAAYFGQAGGPQAEPAPVEKGQARLSAGRVQSVALKLIVDRETEILGFIPVEYWSIEAELAKEDKNSPSFRAGLVGLANGDKIELKDKGQTDKLVAKLEKGYRENGIVILRRRSFRIFWFAICV